MEGLKEAMTGEEITSFLAQVREGAIMAVRYGGNGRCDATLYSQEVASKTPRNGNPLDVQRVVLTSGCVLQRDEKGEWTLTERHAERMVSSPVLTLS